MEIQEPQWLSLAEAAARYDQGTMTVSQAGDQGTPVYLISLVRTKALVGRVGDSGAEIRSDALEILIERDLESFIRRELDRDAS